MVGINPFVVGPGHGAADFHPLAFPPAHGQTERHTHERLCLKNQEKRPDERAHASILAPEGRDGEVEHLARLLTRPVAAAALLRYPARADREAF